MKKRLLAAMLALCMTLTMFPTITTSAADELLETKVIENGVTHQVSTGSAITPEDNIEDLVTPKPDNAAPINEELEQNNSQQETTEMQPKVDFGNVASGTCGKDGDNVRWSLDMGSAGGGIDDGIGSLTDLTLTISGTGEMADFKYSTDDTDIPWFKYSSRSSKIKKVVIEKGVTNIGNCAFLESENLTSVTIPDGIISVGSSAFEGCKKLSKILLPDVVNIDQGAFRWCGLDSIVLPKIKYIGGSAFLGCSQLASTVLGENIEEIGSYAFSDCDNLVNINLPNGITRIQTGTFRGCNNLTTITIPNSVTCIENYAFRLSGLISITIPSSITEIKEATFFDCSNLKNVIISDGVPQIGFCMFTGCRNLKNIYIANSVKSIGGRAFQSCDSLTSIYYGGSENDWESINIESLNDELLNATIHYNSKPTDTPKLYAIAYGDRQYEVFDSSLEKIVTDTASTEYNPLLAHMLITLCNSVHSETNIRKSFLNLGFSEMTTNYAMDDIYLAYGMAKKQLANGRNLVLIVARGSVNGIEWAGNIFDSKANAQGEHSSFADAGIMLNTKMEEFLGGDIIASGAFTNTDFVITGHSRGAAAANILAAHLVDEGIPQSNIYCNTFACPDTAVLTESKAEYYKCIYNIGNVNDTVTWVPRSIWAKSGEKNNWGKDSYWSKYGKSYWYSKDWEDYTYLHDKFAPLQLWDRISKYHLQNLYLDDLRSEKALTEYRNRERTTEAIQAASKKRKEESDNNSLKFNAHLIEILCPVDVEIYTRSGILAGKIVNNTAITNMSDIVHLQIDNDKKYIYLLNNDNYTIKLTGTDDGIMTYLAYNFDPNTSEILEEKTFAGVTLKKGKKMITNISVWDKSDSSIDIEDKIPVPNIQLYILDDDGNLDKEILPDGKGTELQITYTITLDANGGILDSTAIKTADGRKISNLPVPTRNGYQFIGWYTSANAGTKVTTDTVFNDDITIYAHWIANSTDSPSDGSGSSEDNNSSGNGSLGGGTNGGSTGGGSYGGGYYGGSNYIMNYTITFNVSGGVLDTATSKTGTNGKLSSLPTPMRSGYKFDGWYTELSGGTQITTDTIFNKNMTIYAHWTELQPEKPIEPGTDTQSVVPDVTPEQPSLSTYKKGDKVTDISSKAVYKITKIADSDGVGGTVAYVSSTNKQPVNVMIPDAIKLDGTSYKVTKVLANAFKNKTSLKTVKLGKNAATIGNGAFYGCKNLKTVTIGNGVKTIWSKAFYKCKSLTKIVIPIKVTKIGKQAFYGCKKLKTIQIKTTKLATKTIGSKAFAGIASKATIIVPAKSLKTYKKLLVAKGISQNARIKK